jgi:diguanylate cyclase (GGDEF)-like protein/PAS domain S-box-containing protein
MEKYDEMHKDLLKLKEQMNPKRESFRLILLYLLIGVVWILMSDLILSVLFDDVSILTKIQTIKGWIYIAATSLFFYFIILKRLNLFTIATNEIFNNYEELSAANEELLALEEELSQKYDELERNHRALALSEQRYELVIEGSNDGIWDWDVVNRNFFYSLKLKEFYGYNSVNFDNSYDGWVNILHPDDREKVLKKHKEFFNTDLTIYENKYRIVTKTGIVRWIHSRGKAIRDNNGQVLRMAGSHTDITDQVELEENLFFLAYNDRLTSLPNWKKFENELKKSINNSLLNSNKLAILYLDISNFRTINDTLGHKTGNLFLQSTASILREFSSEDIFCARLSGGTFALILTNVEKESEMEEITNRIINRLHEPWVFEGHNFYRTVNVGIAIYPDHALDTATLQRNADTVLNYLKSNNKQGIMFYNKEMSEITISHMNMLNDLHEALLNEDFQLYYQPQICLKSNSIVGVEALIRWFNTKTGFVSPAEFIPVAEKMGYIKQIDKWVINTAFRDKATWNKVGFSDLKMSINISSGTLVDPDFPEMIRDSLLRYRLDPSEIEIEITETAIISDMEAALRSINFLRDLGVSIALDDFGTGFSSLTHLKELPITVLKIDKQFLDKIGKEDESDLIVTSVITLSHNLNIKVVAEGVETEQQLNFLALNNCDVGQGYYFSKPINTDQLNSTFLVKEA